VTPFRTPRPARSGTRTVVVCGAAITAVLVLNGVALAYRSTSVAATGTGPATASNNQLTFTLSGASGALLYPGGPAGTVNVNLTNPFSQTIAITNVTVTPSATGSCPATSFTTDASGIPATIGSGISTYAVSVSMTSTAANGCQGSSVSLSVTITGKL
jgi:hypothetical protein